MRGTARGDGWTVVGRLARVTTMGAMAVALGACARNPRVENVAGGEPEATRTGASRDAATTATMAASQAALVSANVRSDAHVLGLLGQVNRGEIAAAAVAEAQAQTPDVTAFARQMVADHAALDAEGAGVAQRSGIAAQLPDESLARLQQASLTGLRPLTGAALERAYAADQVLAHRRTLLVLERTLPTVRDAALRRLLADEVRPRVAMHLRMAEDLQRRLLTNP